MAPEKRVEFLLLDALGLNFFIARGHVTGRWFSHFTGFGAL